MTLKIVKLSNPGTDTVTFMATAEDGKRFAIDTGREEQHDLARATLRRFVSDYERKRMAKFVKEVEPLLKREPTLKQWDEGAHERNRASRKAK